MSELVWHNWQGNPSDLMPERDDYPIDSGAWLIFADGYLYFDDFAFHKCASVEIAKELAQKLEDVLSCYPYNTEGGEK
jgi:hypothetical protein